MRFRHLAALTLLVSGAPALHAQSPSPQCNQIFTGDACQKATDIFKYLAPQLGTLIAGGAPALGQNNVLTFVGGGRVIPQFSIGARVNLMSASVPDLTDVPVSLSGPSNSTPINVIDQLVPGPTIDAAIGLFNGIPLGAIDILAVDVLLSALYLPDFEARDASVQVEGSGLRLGWGARVGLLQESIVTPALTASYLRRDLPVVNISASSSSGGNSADFSVLDLHKTTHSWRLMLSKTLVGFSLGGGAGWDNYDVNATVTARINNTGSGAAELTSNVTRFVWFGDLALHLGPIRLAGEVGRVQGGDISTFNNFDGARPDAARLYGSLGLRLGI